MANRTRAQIITDIGTKLADNTSGAITPTLLREIATDLADSTARPGLTDCTGALTLVTVGDSITAGTDNWPALLIEKSAFAGRGATLVNVAISSAGTEGDVGQVATLIAPYAPSAGETMIVTYCKGTNDGIVAGVGEGVSTYNTWVTRFEDWCDAVYALNAGGTIIIIAMTTTDRFDVAGGEEFDIFLALQNAYFRKNAGTQFDFLLDRALMFPDNTDSFWFADQLHHTTAGKERIAYDLNQLLTTGGMINYPPASEGVVIGTAGSAVPSNTLLTTTPRAYTAAQGHAETTIADATTFDWNLDTNPRLRLPEIGSNKTINNPTNMRAGFEYTLVLPFNATGGYTITWGDAYKNTPTLNTAGYRHNVTRWYCDGTRMVGMGVNTFDATPPVEPGEGVLVTEEFNDVGAAGRTVRGAAPDTLNTPGNLWIAGRGESYQAGNVPSGNPGYATNSGTSSSNVYELAESDFFAEALMRFADATSSGHAGIVFRYVDSNNYWIFGLNGAGGYKCWKVTGGGFTTIVESTYTYNGTDGNLIRVEATGNTIVMKIDGTTVHTVASDSAHATATKHGYGDLNLGSSKARWFKVELGT
jgi:hypothetical protein